MKTQEIATLDEIMASEDEIRMMLNNEDPLEGIYSIYGDIASGIPGNSY